MPYYYCSRGGLCHLQNEKLLINVWDLQQKFISSLEYINPSNPILYVKYHVIAQYVYSRSISVAQAMLTELDKRRRPVQIE